MCAVTRLSSFFVHPVSTDRLVVALGVRAANPWVLALIE